MKSLTDQIKLKTIRSDLLKFVFPIAITSMFMFTKWWFVIPVDGPDKIFWGFPLACIGEGFHTSMSFQIFMFELFANFFIYLLCWTILKIVLQWSFPQLYIHPIITKFIWATALFFLISFGMVVSTSNPIFNTTRRYDWKVITSGYIFVWQTTPKPDLNKPIITNKYPIIQSEK